MAPHPSLLPREEEKSFPRTRFLVAVLSALLLSTADGNIIESHFDDVRARAKAMGETEEGKRYEHGLNSEVSDVFSKPFAAALRECTKETKPPYKVTIILMIAADGQTRILTPPNEPVSTCVAEKLNRLKLPPPPKPDWLVAVNITVNE